MDPTTQALLAAILGALVAGSAVLAWHVSERQQQRHPEPEEPIVSADVRTVLSVLRSSAVVVDADDVVRKASAPAYALGLVRGDRLVQEDLAELVRQVRRDGQIRESELVITGGLGVPQRHLSARVAPLSSRLVLVLVEDRTREHRIEAVRRDFVANVSHELKTPVGAIKLLAEAVDQAADDPEAVRRFAGRMVTESDRLTLLVQQVIELSRLQADDPLATPQPVPVRDVLARAVDASSTDADSRGIAVVTDAPEELMVLGSPDQIALAVSNLVANAVTYSPAGSTVAVGARGTDREVEISVVDQGIGISANDLERIFERFYRVDPARRRSTGGTGLGLSIVKHVASTHGGDVRVWSVEGQGSTFSLTLPRASQETAL